MSANLISVDEFHKIALFETTSEFIAFLKNHPGYRDIFRQYDEHELHRFDADRMFINGYYYDFSKIYRFANDIQRRDLDFIFFRHEVTILKNYIRHVFNKGAQYDLSFYKEFFDKHSRINVAALSSSVSMDEFITNLSGTDYYPLLSRLGDNDNVNSFDYEMQLDIYYFKKAWETKDKLLDGDSLKAFTHRLGTEIDLLNIMWIYRYKMSYDFNNSNILSVIIPVNYKLSKEQLLKLVNANSKEDFFSLLKNTHYKNICNSLANGTMERTCKNIISKIYASNKAKYPASMNTVSFYLYRKEAEITQLTTALECIRYGLEPNSKLKYILQ
jgi:V/A-type H+-transporting ATPase subunit C